MWLKEVAWDDRIPHAALDAIALFLRKSPDYDKLSQAEYGRVRYSKQVDKVAVYAIFGDWAVEICDWWQEGL
jgi:hypothetical protein